MRIPLAPDDPVRICVNAMHGLLKLLPVKYLLTNGKIEKPLKFFMGAAWENGNTKTRACATDKQPFNNLELDLLAFENTLEQFWAETKCSFIQDSGDIIKSAAKAMKQTKQRLYEIHKKDLYCDGYLVHFLTSLPQEHDILLPGYILQLFEKLRPRVPFVPDALETFYEAGLQNHYHSSATVSIWPDPNAAPVDAAVSAVVVRLQRPPALNL